MFAWDGALKIAGSDLFLDSRAPRTCSFISHAHSDHLGVHRETICTSQTSQLASQRIALGVLRTIDYGVETQFQSDLALTLLPAGHVLGSAMLYATRGDESLLYTGDFKLRPSLTCEPATPVQADTLVMECTFGLPIFRFPPREQSVARLCEGIEAAFRSNRQPIVLAYSLGKAQEVNRMLTEAGFTVTQHGAPAEVSRMYRELGTDPGPFRSYDPDDFHGPGALELRERGVLLAPPQVARTAFVHRFDRPATWMVTGWGMLKDAKYRYGVDEVIPISDHADFDELLRFIELVQPRRVFTHHGFMEFADHLRSLGIDAQPAKPDPQLRLFE
jgi:Cft2 family RNA processing exonuclease